MADKMNLIKNLCCTFLLTLGLFQAAGAAGTLQGILSSGVLKVGTTGG